MFRRESVFNLFVSMKSGLEDRNNLHDELVDVFTFFVVSMKSGLEDRNNPEIALVRGGVMWLVSMKSGLEDRNNDGGCHHGHRVHASLNEVRPGRPEQ